VVLSLPAATRCCGTWPWLVVVSSAKQKQQLHHQQLTNGSTILKTFTFPKFLDSFKLIYSIFWINFGDNIFSDVHTKDVAFRRTKEWCKRDLKLEIKEFKVHFNCDRKSQSPG
jgi:hypothetical protein